MLPRAVDLYRQKRQKSVDYTCRLFGISRQGLYKRKDADRRKLAQAIAVRALKTALKSRTSSAELIHHSDRGIQYCCDAYQRVLDKAKVRVSMTQNGDPLENAIAERINGILKQEFELERSCADIAILKKTIAQTIAIYNNCRPHFSCGLQTPECMHKQAQLQRATYHKKVRSKQTLAPNNINPIFV